ncbi:hypothetical protein D3C72_1863530 [compost metagenome]
MAIVTIISTEPANAPARMLHCTCLSHRCGARSSSHSTGSASAKRSSFSSSELLHKPFTTDDTSIQANGNSNATAMGHNARKSIGS